MATEMMRVVGRVVVPEAGKAQVAEDWEGVTEEAAVARSALRYKRRHRCRGQPVGEGT